MHMQDDKARLTRRGLLGGAAALAAGALLQRVAPAGAAGAVDATAPQAFRFVHFTDIHVQPELRGAEGFRQCIAAVHDLRPRPDFILTGGDLVFDILAQSEARAKMLFDLFTSICRDSDIPWRYCIGNHDVFGWSSKGKIAPDHVSYGKKMVMERLGLERTTWSFDHKGWHFALVDSVQRPSSGREGYEGGISGEDLDWLRDDLQAAGNRPKVMCLHIPVVSAAAFRRVDVSGNQERIGPRRELLCRNVGPILDLLRETGVNLVLSGHLHQNERITFERTTHIEDGAVCGAWWKGAHYGNPEGFGIIDVKPDGTFEHRYETYGWKAVAS